ncbi:PREDICTED: putative spermatogenesis-associated protein 31D3 isoform X2 [Chinchilla lanigera]|uniref:putative spermatogenesis-associated protein 31D3 isoform X2 n=1 Tax=Chinchilla lanigera TaxID=34839 RepID=UPI0006987955|nr:PREDICTED: putative spermatogenesis-associated protein 31D3 isoform X2 [Chinchilla lanigera]
MQKLQHRSRRRRRRRSTTLKGWRASLKERQEGRKLLSFVKSPLDQHPDIIHFRQLLCPDPLCDICNTTTAKVSRMFFQASLEDAAHTATYLTSTDSDSSSTQSFAISPVLPGHQIPGPVPEPSPPLPSVLPPNLVTSFVDSLSPVPLGDCQHAEPTPPLDSKSPVDHSPPEPLSCPTSLLYCTQEGKLILQSKSTSSVNDSAGRFSTNHLYPMEASLHHSEGYLVEPGNLKFLSPESWALLERQIKKKGDLLMGKGQGKGTESFPKQHQPDSPLNFPWKRSESSADQWHSARPLPIWSSEGKPEELLTHLKPPGLKTLGDHLEQKYSQFFWGLPSLHSESLNSTVPASGDCSSSFICFNTICSTSTAHESPVPPHPSPLSLPEAQPQPLSQILPQSHFPDTLPVQTQAQCQSPPLSLLPSTQCQPRSCGVCFHGTQGEIQSLTPAEIQHLEGNVLQKVQESVWGLPYVVQRSREDFCPPAPKLSLIRQASKAHMPVSILPGDFPCSSELRKKLEHHLRKRLIQHRWGLPRRVLESLSMMQPRSQVPQASESKESYGLSWISLYKGQSSKDLSQSGTVYERSSEVLPLEEGVGNNEGQSPASGPQNLLSAHDRITDSAQGSYSEEALESEAGEHSESSNVSVHQKHLENALKVHLSKKFEEIHEGQIPDAVNKSWHSINLTLPFPEKSPSQIKGRDRTPLVGKDSYVDTSQDISFLSSSKQKMMEEHILTFRRRMMWGLPHKVQESIEISNIKEDLHPALSHSKSPFSDTYISDLDSKTGVFKTLRRSSNASQAHKVETNSVVGLPHSATSHAGMEGHRALRQSPKTYTNPELTENMRTVERGTQVSLLPTRRNTDTGGQKQTLQDKRRHPKPPTGQAGAAPEVRAKRMRSCSDKGRLQSTVTKQLEYLPKCDKSREIVKAEELSDLQSQTSNISSTGKSGLILRRGVNASKRETSLITKRPLPRTACSQDFKSSKSGNRLLNELKFNVESRKKSQSQGPPTNVSLASKNLKTQTLLHHDQSASGGDMTVSQVMHAHLDITKSHLEQQQAPWFPKQVLCKHQDRKFPPESKRERPLTLKTGDLSGGDARLDTHQHRRRRPDRDRTLEKTLGGKSSQALSPRGEPPPENLFRNKMKHFFKWICPSVKPEAKKAPQKGQLLIALGTERAQLEGELALLRTPKTRKLPQPWQKSFTRICRKDILFP